MGIITIITIIVIIIIVIIIYYYYYYYYLNRLQPPFVPFTILKIILSSKTCNLP